MAEIKYSNFISNIGKETNWIIYTLQWTEGGRGNTGKTDLF